MNDKIDGMSLDIQQKEREKLQSVFPQCFNEGKLDSDQLVAYLNKNAVSVDHSVYDHIIYDSSTVELPFAIDLDNDPDVRMFFKIPDKFKIETPIGTYNPDWAVYIDMDGNEKLYFVLETKGVSGLLDMDNLKTSQQQKIRCGERHFAALGNDISFPAKPVKDWREFKKGV